MTDIKYPETTIHSFEQFIDEIAKHASTRQIEPRLFRGQANKQWHITSTMYRNLFEAPDENNPILRTDPKLLADAINQHLHESRLRQSSYPRMAKMNDFDLLAEIQHMGGVSPFIDYTSNPLIALFFACANEQSCDGSISCITPYSDETLIEIKVEAETNWDMVTNNHHISYFWQLPRNNQRILKQNGYFVFNAMGYMPKYQIEHFFIIDSRKKQKICSTLDQACGINWDSVYPDFLGYIQNY